jgi:hypothetical protein
MKKPYLKACPFCGESGKLVTWYPPMSEPLYKVHCENSQCVIRPSTQYSPSEGSVVNFWNGRGKWNICGICDNAEWDMPQCRECSGLNDWKHFTEKRGERTDSNAKDDP